MTEFQLAQSLVDQTNNRKYLRKGEVLKVDGIDYEVPKSNMTLEDLHLIEPSLIKAARSRHATSGKIWKQTKKRRGGVNRV